MLCLVFFLVGMLCLVLKEKKERLFFNYLKKQEGNFFYFLVICVKNRGQYIYKMIKIL